MSRITAGERKLLICQYYERFHQTQYLEWDPLLIVHQFKGSPAQEYVALISALLALGGVKQIIASIRSWVSRLDLQNQNLLDFTEAELLSRASGFRHRFYVDRDLVLITLLYQRSVCEYGGLAQHFLIHHQASNETVEEALAGVINDYRSWAKMSDFKAGAHFAHLLNSPVQGSTCKRWLMYLKWMIRKDDGIDLGLWSEFSDLRPDQLLIPLDTHLFKISKKLGLTHRKTANWKTSIEVTRNLKKIDPLDPTRFDFSLCRFGMLDYRKMLADR